MNEEVKKSVICSLLALILIPIICVALFIAILNTAGSWALAFLLILAAAFPLIFVGMLSFYANQWSIKKQIVHAALFTLVVSVVDAAALVLFHRNISFFGRSQGYMIMCIILLFINDWSFFDYILHFKQMSKEYSCKNRIGFVIECDRERHDRLTMGIYSEDEEEFIERVGPNMSSEVLLHMLEGESFVSFISQKYNYDYGATFRAIRDNSGVRDVLAAKEQKAEESESEEP